MLGRIKIYTVHIRPDRVRAYEQPVFVGEGFSWLAFLFTFLWAGYQRLWKVAALLLLAHMMVGWLGHAVQLSEPSIGVMQFAIQIIAGFYGNDWLRAGLARRGYILADIASGGSLLAAQQRFFERHIATSAA